MLEKINNSIIVLNTPGDIIVAFIVYNWLTIINSPCTPAEEGLDFLFLSG